MNRMLVFLSMMMAASFMLVVPASAQYTIFYWNPTSGVDFNTAANWSGGDPTLPGGKVFWIEGSTPVAITATPPYPADPIYTIPLFGGILNQTGGDVVVTPYQLICKNSAYNMTGGTYWAQGMQEYFSVGRFEGSGTLNVSGGYFKIDPSTVAGGDGIAMTVANPNQATGTVSGSVTVSGTGTIDCQTGFVSVCANGVVNIGDQSTSGVAGGVLKTLEVIGGQYYHGGGGGVLNFDGGTLVCTANVLGGYQFVELAEVNLLANGGTIEVPNGVTVRSDAVRGVAPISGIGGLAKTGDGVLVLAGTYNSYAGATTVQQGTLSLEGVQLASSSILVKPQGTLSGYTFGGTYPTVTVESGGSIATNSSGYSLYLTSMNLADGANLKFNAQAGAADQIISVGDILTSGTDPITVNVHYAGSLTAATTVLTTAGNLSSNITFQLPGGLPMLDTEDGVHTDVTLFTQSGAGGYVQLNPGGTIADPSWNDPAGGSWNTSGKWGPPNTAPSGGGDRAMFNAYLGSGTIPILLNTSPQLSSMIFASPLGESYDISPLGNNSITLDSTIAENWHITVLSGIHEIKAGLKLAAGSGTILNQSAIRLVDGAQLTLSGVISDDSTTAAGINLVGNFNAGFGTGVLTLTGDNSFTGPVVVTSGILEIVSIGNADTDNTLGRSDPSPANFKLGGTLRYLGADANPASNRGFTTTAATGTAATLDIANASVNLTLSGQARSTSGGLLKTGPGTATFVNAVAENILAAEGFTVNQGSVAFDGGTESVYLVGGNAMIDNGSSLRMSSGKLHMNGYIIAQNSSTETLGGSSQVSATGFGVLKNARVTLSDTATIVSAASIGVHEGAILNLNSTGVIPGDSDGYTVRVANLLAIGFNTPNTTGVVNISSGKVFSTNLWVGNEAGNLGSLNIVENGTYLTTAAAIGSVTEGEVGGGVGYVSVRGGTFKHISPTDPIYLGVFGDGLIDVAAGSMDCTTPSVELHYPGMALMIGGVPGIAGILNVRGSGSVLTTTNKYGLRGNAIVNVGVSGDASGTLQAAAFVAAQSSGSRVGTINFHGGTLVATVDADGVTVPEGGASPNPVLIANGESDVSHVYVHVEGAIIDTNGHNVVIDAPLESPATGGVYSAVSIAPFSIPMSSGGNGTGYIATPYVKVLDGDGTGPGTGATAIAVMSATNPDQVDHVEITNPGEGYVNPTFMLVGGLGASGVAASIDGTRVTTGANESGGLTKLGEGTLTLTSVPTYSGDTYVHAGTLNLPSLNTPSATVTVYDGGTLNAVSIVTDTLVIGGTSSLAPAVAVPEPGTMMLLAFGVLALAGVGFGRKYRR